MGGYTVTEKIKFLGDGSIDRTFPILLADHGKLNLQIWDKFCDDVDTAVKKVGPAACVETILWIITIASCWILWFVWIPWEEYYYKTCRTVIQKECSKFANRDRDMSMELIGKRPKKWYIEVTLRNVGDVENPVAVAATAVPVAVAAEAAAVPSAPSPSMPEPKKYIKDSSGKLILNPDYKSWKASQ